VDLLRPMIHIPQDRTHPEALKAAQVGNLRQRADGIRA
jgi:hypothetical protein